MVRPPRSRLRLARGMLASGISKGSRLGLLMPNSPDFVVAWLAAARIGAIIIPINTFYKPKELAFVLHHADIQVLLTADKLLNNDYLARLETCIPQLLEQPHSADSNKPLLLREFPFLRHIYVWGEAARHWSSSQQHLLDAAELLDEEYLASRRGLCLPGRSVDHRLQLWQHRRSQGRHAQPGQRYTPLLQSQSLARYTDRRPDFFAHAFFLGRRPGVHAALRHAQGLHTALRRSVRSGKNLAIDRARARHPGDRLAALRHGPGQSSQSRSARSVLDSRRQYLPPAPAQRPPR